MPASTCGSLSMHSTTTPSSGVAGHCRLEPASGRSAGSATAIGTSTEKVDPLAGAERSVDLVVEHARDALDDRQAEPEAARDARALLEALEFLEDDLLLRGGHAEAGVENLNATRSCRVGGSRQARDPSGCI